MGSILRGCRQPVALLLPRQQRLARPRPRLHQRRRHRHRKQRLHRRQHPRQHRHQRRRQHQHRHWHLVRSRQVEPLLRWLRHHLGPRQRRGRRPPAVLLPLRLVPPRPRRHQRRQHPCQHRHPRWRRHRCQRRRQHPRRRQYQYLLRSRQLEPLRPLLRRLRHRLVSWRRGHLAVGRARGRLGRCQLPRRRQRQHRHHLLRSRQLALQRPLQLQLRHHSAARQRLPAVLLLLRQHRLIRPRPRRHQCRRYCRPQRSRRLHPHQQHPRRHRR